MWHLNEGHAAFVALQRIREQVEKGVSFDEALDAVRRSTVFTTHTPVPAGHDAFPFSMVESTWPAAGASWASTARAFSPSASTTTGTARSST